MRRRILGDLAGRPSSPRLLQVTLVFRDLQPHHNVFNVHLIQVEVTVGFHETVVVVLGRAVRRRSPTVRGDSQLAVGSVRPVKGRIQTACLIVEALVALVGQREPELKKHREVQPREVIPAFE